MSAAKKSAGGFTAAERKAMQERAEELRSASGKGAKKKADEARALLDKIEEMSQPDRALAERIHAVVSEVAPDLHPKTWYGMPAYARDGKVVCFFKPAEKFGTRYATLGFSDLAKLDDGSLWPTEYAVADLGDAEVKRIEQLLRRAVG